MHSTQQVRLGSQINERGANSHRVELKIRNTNQYYDQINQRELSFVSTVTLLVSTNLSSVIVENGIYPMFDIIKIFFVTSYLIELSQRPLKFPMFIIHRYRAFDGPISLTARYGRVCGPYSIGSWRG